jgi:hypothetical protein
MNARTEIIMSAGGALKSGDFKKLSYCRLGFDPAEDGSIPEIELRHPKRGKKKVTERCQGKVRFKDREQAKAALITIRYSAGVSSLPEAKEKGLPIREYPCFMGCNGFHLTSQDELGDFSELGLTA